MVDRRGSRHGSDIEENADIGLQDGAERVEEPTVRVDFLLVLLLQAKDDLDWNVALLRAFDLQVGAHRNYGRSVAAADD